MATIEPFKNGDPYSKAIAYAASLPYALFPLGYLIYSIYVGHDADMVIWFLVMVGFIVSAYKIWGKSNVKDALDEARQGDEPDEDTPE